MPASRRIFLLAFHGSILPRSLAGLNRPYRRRIIAMGAKKKQVPAFVDPPGPLAPIEDWIEHRRELDRLEAELRVSRPDLAWADELQSLKAETPRSRHSPLRHQQDTCTTPSARRLGSGNTSLIFPRKNGQG